MASLTTGEFPPWEPPDRHRRLTDRQRRDLQRAPSRVIVGDEDTVAERLDELVERTGADELSTFGTDALAESDARLAALLPGVTGDVRHRPPARPR